MDSLLQAYIEARTEQSAESLLDVIVNAKARSADKPAASVMEATRRAVLVCWRVRSGPQDTDFVGEECEAAEATFSEARLRIIVRLRHLRAAFWENPVPEERTATGIADLAAYAYRTTLNAAADILREAYPERYRLDCALRYTLRNSSRLAVWDAQEDHQKRKQMAGLRQWLPVHSREYPSFRQSVYHAYLEAARQRWRLVTPPASDPETLPLEQVAVAVLSDIGGPIPLRDFRYILATLRGVQKHTTSGLSEYTAERSPPGQISGELTAHATGAYSREQTAGRISDMMMLRAEAEFLWQEICQLPPLQRLALLLNPRGATMSGDIMTLLVTLGIATEAQIATSMNMRKEQFDQIWQDMPLEDAAIAQRLMPAETTGRDVSNLRKAAIDRLTRRHKAHFSPAARKHSG